MFNWLLMILDQQLKPRPVYLINIITVIIKYIIVYTINYLII